MDNEMEDIGYEPQIRDNTVRDLEMNTPKKMDNSSGQIHQKQFISIGYLIQRIATMLKPRTQSCAYLPDYAGCKSPTGARLRWGHIRRDCVDTLSYQANTPTASAAQAIM